MNWSISGVEDFPKGNNPLGNRFYGYKKRHITLPDGREAIYNGVAIGDCVHTVGVDDDETTYFVRQTRPNVQRGTEAIPTTLELPGGFAIPELSLEASAAREFSEEVGLRALRMDHIGTLWPSTGISDERDHIFLAQNLSPVENALAERETTEQDMRIVTMPFGQAYELFTSGSEPVSAQTLSALALAKRFL